jgi:hypothetical protein
MIGEVCQGRGRAGLAANNANRTEKNDCRQNLISVSASVQYDAGTMLFIHRYVNRNLIKYFFSLPHQ